MASKPKITKQADVFSLPVPKKDDAVYFDKGPNKDRVAGLALRVGFRGYRTWAFYYRLNGKQKRLTLGDTSLTLDAARQIARKHRIALADGKDPAIEIIERRANTALTAGALIADYLKARQRDMKPRSLVECTRHLQVLWKPLHGLPAGSVTRALVATNLRRIADNSGPIAANRARATLSAMYGWAIGEGVCNENPVIGTNKPAQEKTRDRVLTDAELVKIWRSTPESDYGKIVRLLMLTAQRRDEIGSLRWSEIPSRDDPAKAQIELPGERTKNGRPHVVPLSGEAIAILEATHERAGRDLVFGEGEGGYSGWSRAKEVLDDACGVKDWTLHDLRRSAATGMANIGVQPHVIEAVLNHISGHKSGVAGIYNRSTYAAEKREALASWASHLRVAIASAEGANVVRMTKGKVRVRK
jgi:integrase